MIVTRLADGPSDAMRYSHRPPNGRFLSAMWTTSRCGAWAVSTTYVIAPSLECSRHEGPVAVGASTSTLFTSGRQLGKRAGSVSATHTVSGVAAMRADRAAT